MVLQGVLLPFVVTSTGDVANGNGCDLAIAKVTLVLGTRPGEIDWRPDFGCGIHLLRHQNNTDMLAAMAGIHVRKSFADWLPSYVLTAIKPTVDGRNLRLAVGFNQRSATGAPLYPRDLMAQVAVALAAASVLAS